MCPFQRALAFEGILSSFFLSQKTSIVNEKVLEKNIFTKDAEYPANGSNQSSKQQSLVPLYTNEAQSI